jgi:boron transporter
MLLKMDPAEKYHLPHAVENLSSASPPTWRSRKTWMSHLVKRKGDVSLRKSFSERSRASNVEPKWWRIKYCRGMINDIKRRAPYYWSDWKDAWDYRVVPATVYMYFAKYVSTTRRENHLCP